jgi:hypothetical protein
MEAARLLADPKAQDLLAYLDPDLPSPQRIALLGIANGYSLSQLSYLPGLRQAGRLRAASDALITAGRVRLEPSGYAVVPGSRPDPATANALLGQRKLAATFELLIDPAGGLYARGLSGMAVALGAELGASLDRALRRIELLGPPDAEYRRRDRHSRLHYVERNVPRHTARMTADGLRPQTAPSDMLARTVEQLTTGLPRGLRDAREMEIRALYRALVGLGEKVFPYWWGILIALAPRELPPAKLWVAWRGRLESHCLRLRIPLDSKFRYRKVEPRLLRARYPVPPCGYGPWVDHELRLWRMFKRRYGAALGPRTKFVWLRTHEEVARQLRDEFPGAEPGLIDRPLYEQRLGPAAQKLSGLSEEVLADLRARRYQTPAVKAARRHAEQELADREVRVAVRKAIRFLGTTQHHAPRHSTDTLLAVRQAIDLADPSPTNWAARLLHWVAQREAVPAGSTQALAELLENAADWKPRGGMRYRHRTLAERVVSTLDHGFERQPVLVGPRELLPIAEVQARVQRALGYVQQCARKEEERATAEAAILDYLRNCACITMVTSLGSTQRATVQEACQLTGRPDLAERVFGVMSRLGQAA